MTNTNFANRNKFKFLIHYPDQREFEFFAKSFTFGGLTLGMLSIPTPIRIIEYPGDSIQIEDMVVDFYIDEDWTTWIELFNWIKAIKSSTQALNNPLLMAGATLKILNTKYREVFQIELIDIWPYSLTTINLDTDDDTTPLMGQILFKCNDMNVIAKQ